MNSKQQAVATNSSTELRQRFVLLLTLRMGVMTALLGSTVFFNWKTDQPHFTISQILVYSVVSLVYLGTAITTIFYKLRKLNLLMHLQGQVSFDVFTAGVLVYLTGGVESPFSFFFSLPVITTAVFFPRRGIFLTASLSCLLLGAIFILEQQGVLPVALEGRLGVVPATGRVVYLLSLNFTVFFAIAWLSGALGEQLKSTGRLLARTEIDLERMSAMNRDIVQSLRSGLLVIDRAGVVSMLNPVAEQILGVDSAQARGRPIAEVFSALAAIMSPGTNLPLTRDEVDHQVRGQDTVIPVGLMLSELINPEGDLAGTLVHMQDLTEKKKLAASVKKAEKLAVLGQMAASMAHEIRNPLAAMSGSVQMLKTSAVSFGEDDLRLMDIIRRETKRLDVLLTDFLAYARPKEPQRTLCALDELVVDTVTMFLRGQKKKPPIQTALKAVSVRVDPDQIRQVLWNLINNAVQAAAESGSLHLQLWEESSAAGEKEAVIEIRDEGEAIEAELRDRIFEPFFTTKAQGSGLGLANVSRIVESHGGTIQLQCPEEGGNIFLVRLPGVVDE